MTGEDGTPGIVVEAFGVPVGIPVSGSAAVRLGHQWSRALTDREATTVVDLDNVEPDDAVSHDYAITVRVTLAALEATAGRRLNLHAGVVADPQGRALALIGPSGSGKTTAISLLATRLGYLSDETVSLEESLLVHAHPKPLSIITDIEAPRAKQSLSPDDLDLLHPPERAHLHRLVLLHRGAGDAGLVPVPAPRAIVEMIEQTSSLVQLEHPLHRIAAAIDACGGVWALEYVEFGDHLADMLDLLDRDPQQEVEHVHHPCVAVSGPVAGAWSRAAWTDAEEYADELVLMIDDQVHVLAGLGVILWLALRSPRSTDELVAETQALWGEHPDAAALVADALDVMLEQRMVQPPA